MKKTMMTLLLSAAVLSSSLAMAAPADRQALLQKEQEIEQAQTEIASMQVQLTKLKSVRDSEITIAYGASVAIVAGGIWATIRGIFYGYDGASMGLKNKVISGLYVITPAVAAGGSFYLAHVNSNQISQLLEDLSNEQHRLAASQAALKEMLAE